MKRVAVDEVDMAERLRGDRAISSIEKLGVKDGVREEDRMANVTERLEELQGARSLGSVGASGVQRELRAIGHATAVKEGFPSYVRQREL